MEQISIINIPQKTEVLTFYAYEDRDEHKKGAANSNSLHYFFFFCLHMIFNLSK